MNEFIIIPHCQWDDFQEVAISKGLPLSYSQESDGYHVYGDSLDELEAILWAIQVVDGLGTIFSSEMAVKSALIGAEDVNNVM